MTKPNAQLVHRVWARGRPGPRVGPAVGAGRSGHLTLDCVRRTPRSPPPVTSVNPGRGGGVREQGGDLPLGRSVAHGHLLLFHSRSRAGTNARKVLEGSGMVFAAVFLPGRWGSCGRCRGVGMASEAHRTGGQDRVLVWAPWLVRETVLSALGLQALWGPCGGPAGGAGAMGRARTPCCGRTGQKAQPLAAPLAPAVAPGPSLEILFSDGDARALGPSGPRTCSQALAELKGQCLPPATLPAPRPRRARAFGILTPRRGLDSCRHLPAPARPRPPSSAGGGGFCLGGCGPCVPCLHPWSPARSP